MTKGNLNDLIRDEVKKDRESSDSIATPPKRPRETNATLQAQINELTASLHLSEENCQRLQARVNDLTAELQQQTEKYQQQQTLQVRWEEQADLVKQLSGQLERSSAEVATQKQLIEKLYHQIQVLETPPPPTPEPPPPAEKIGLYNFEIRTLTRYVAPAPAPTTLTNADIGWFD